MATTIFVGSVSIENDTDKTCRIMLHKPDFSLYTCAACKCQENTRNKQRRAKKVLDEYWQ